MDEFEILMDYKSYRIIQYNLATELLIFEEKYAFEIIKEVIKLVQL